MSPENKKEAPQINPQDKYISEVYKGWYDLNNRVSALVGDFFEKEISPRYQKLGQSLYYLADGIEKIKNEDPVGASKSFVLASLKGAETILNDMKLFMQRSIVAKMFDIPVIKLGDLVRFGGGKVDIRRNVIGVPTSIVWKYRGIMTVTCTAPEAVTEEVA